MIINKIKIRHRIIFFALAFAYSFCLIGLSLAKAETATSTIPEVAPACELNKAVDELLSIKDGALTGLARDRAEFKARKAVIEQTIICAPEEINQIKEKLEGLVLETPEDEGMRTQFLASLVTSEESYAKFSEAVSTSIGLTDIKKLAEDILEWRKNDYVPLLSKINDFILVINNEQSIKIARARFDKIKSTITILRLSSVPSIKSLLVESSKLTEKADKLSSDAHKLVLKFYVPTEILSTESTSSVMLVATGTQSLASTTANSSGTVKEIKKGIESGIIESTPMPTSTSTVVSLVKSSIGSLKSAYNNYLKISVTVRNILGL